MRFIPLSAWSIISLILVTILSTPAIGSSTSTFEKSRSAYDNGNYTGALFYLKQVLNSDPKNVSILTDFGSTLSNLGNYSQAISYFKKALTIDPHHKGAFLGLGEIMNRSRFRWWVFAPDFFLTFPLEPFGFAAMM
jgi:tetratricopeptide (TPR) repeat protein